MRHTTRATLLLLASLLLACSGDDDPPTRPTTTLSPEAEVEAAYLAYWDMVERLTESPESNSSEITQRTTEPAKEQLLTSIASLRDAGHAIESGPQTSHHIREVTIDGDEARLEDCYVDDSVTVEISSGSALETRLATDLLEISFAKDDDVWLASEINVLGSWDGAVPCDD